MSPPDRRSPWGGFLILTIIVVALVHVTAVRRRWVIADACGVDPAIAVRIVGTRRVMGMPFAGVDDVFNHVEIPVDQWDRARERAVVDG